MDTRCHPQSCSAVRGTLSTWYTTLWREPGECPRSVSPRFWEWIPQRHREKLGCFWKWWVTVVTGFTIFLYCPSLFRGLHEAMWVIRYPGTMNGWVSVTAVGMSIQQCGGIIMGYALIVMVPHSVEIALIHTRTQHMTNNRLTRYEQIFVAAENV